MLEREKEEIVRLSALGLPSRLIGQEIGRHHRTVWAYLQRLRRPAPLEPIRSPLRLSLREREEISRGLAAGESCAWNAESESVPYVTLRAPARTTTDRSSRATRASPGRRGTRPPANPRSVAVTTAPRASTRPLLATGDTPPTSRPSDAELERVQLDPPCRPDSGALHRYG